MPFQTTMWSAIARARAGSRADLEELLSRYRAPIFEYVRHKGLSEADAEDITQEVFVQICEERFLERADRSKGLFRTLLLRVTQHVLSSEFRRRYAQKRGGNRPAVSIEEIQDIAVAAEDEERFNMGWARHLLLRALERLKKEGERLKAPYHRALVRRLLEDASYKEIAAEFGCKEADLANYVYLGKQRLRKHLDDLTSEYAASPEEFEAESAIVKNFAS
jgi:RNA polymerase sigma factor (sigma-70 family)